MAETRYKPGALDSHTRAFYARTLAALDAAGVPILVGGAYALERYTGIERHTKDFDLFTRRRDYEAVARVLAQGGCRTELPFPHWLGKAHCGGDFVDLIFSSGNGIAEVDDEWFEHAEPAEVFGRRVLLCPPEETIWSKAFVMERERFDGADVIHLLRARGAALDWARLLKRFGPHWRVLLSHLLLFDFTHPCERAQIPRWVREELWHRVREEMDAPPRQCRVCYGTLLSREQYLIDIDVWRYDDARLEAGGSMSREEVDVWTAAIGQ
jgi:hypothetical protein